MVNGTDIGSAVEKALAINKQVTLKSAARPFELVRNSALFLIYYGYCVVFFNQMCPDKTQNAILQVYGKIEKARYTEYTGLEGLLLGLRGLPSVKCEDESD